MIEVHIHKQLGRFTLDAQFSAGPGVTALYGPSGAGKTTIVQAVAGLIRPDAGRIVLGGEVLFDAAAGVNLPPARRRVGYVFQNARLFPHMTVLQNLRYGGRQGEDVVIGLLGLAPLLARRPGGLSGGERQRVAIGRALMSGPRLLLMDEPLASLDPARKADILPYLEALRDQSLPIIYVSHAMVEVARMADTLVIVQDGRIALSGPVADVLCDPAAVPLIGPLDSGAVLVGRIGRHDATDGLTDIVLAAGRLILPGVLGPAGRAIRLRVAAQDIVLSRHLPQDISALNILAVTVRALTPDLGGGMAVQLDWGPDRLLARITQRSADAMGLVPGLAIWALVKATAMAPG